MGISQGLNDFRDRMVPGIIGAIALATEGVETITGVNSAPATAQVGTVVIANSRNSEAFSVVINGVEVTYTSDSSSSKIEIAAGLAAAINAEPLVRGQVSAVSDGVDTVTITALIPGTGFTLTEGENADDMTTTQAATANDEADAIPFGRALIGTGHSDNADLYVRIADSAAETAQVDSYVLTYDAGVLVRVDIWIDDEHYYAEHLMAADLDTSGAAIVTALNGVLPANTVLASYVDATDTLVLTGEVDGKGFESSVSFGTGRDTGAAVKTSTEATVTTDLNANFAGVSVYDPTVPYDTDEDTSTQYPANSAMQILRKGAIWVENSESVVWGDPVYVELAAGASAGKFYKTTSATRVRLDRARWERAGSSADRAILRLLG